MRDPAASLAKLTLCNFEVGTNMKSTGEMTATFTMEDCVLDDTRPEMKDGITKYVCALNFKFRDELTILHGYITPPLCCYNLYLVLTFSLIRRALINDDNNGNPDPLINFNFTRTESSDSNGLYKYVHDKCTNVMLISCIQWRPL